MSRFLSARRAAKALGLAGKLAKGGVPVNQSGKELNALLTRDANSWANVGHASADLAFYLLGADLLRASGSPDCKGML